MLRVEVRVKGCIGKQWSEWFGGLTISQSSPDTTLLAGYIQDQAALYGVISRLRDLGLELASVSSQKIKEKNHE
jgi:hypothetical protein